MEIISKDQMTVFKEFYNRYYTVFAWRCSKAVKDEVIGSGMAQDAFLKLWLLRDQLEKEDNYRFLKSQLKKAITAYFKVPKHRFNANLFRLDELENPEFLMRTVEMDYGGLDHDTFDQGKYQKEWAHLQELIPSLPSGQQELIKLCLKYNFNYDRISYYLGGISDYAVAKQVESLLTSLKQILSDVEKLEMVEQKVHFQFSGGLDDLQKEVLRMRYDLRYSFSEIATHLDIDVKEIKQAFSRASRVCA